ncbi:MAG: hypothetical protein HC939_14630 [Pleurocapsa sp. SU_5_0]|nr:hypothetical protein [Pleurocapsa sp. SU_5_0]NJR45207.1 hypothetical protein [Hyellaceae cyanobacterium CSU_1_1]
MNTDQSQQLSSGNLNDLANSKPTVTAHKLHKYVWGLVGIVGLFFASFPIAYTRVAHNKEFGQQPLHSIDWDESQKANLVYPTPKPK